MARGGSITDMQDRLVDRMTRQNRKTGNLRDSKQLSLKEQLAQLKKEQEKSPEEKMKSLPYPDWEDGLRDFGSKRALVTEKSFRWITVNCKSELEEYHRKGTRYKDLKDWLEDKSMEYMNL
jgi:hypothetical protein